MHTHSVSFNVEGTPSRDQVINALKKWRRIWLIPAWYNIKSTGDITEMGRILGRPKGDMMENCIYEESVSVDGSDIELFQAVHQESDVIPENIDCIRAMTGIEKNKKKSMDKTDKALGIGNFKPWKVMPP
jgi:glyceraldehyde-3-phosphate dehydrogenase (NAD(P))